MIVVLTFLINLLAPIVNTLGLLGVCGMGAYGDWGGFAYCVIMFVVGCVFGVMAIPYDIPPRWFWSRSANEIFNFKIFGILGYGWSFAMWPAAVYFIKCLVDAV